MEQENRMGTDKISSVLLKMGIPVILSMVLQAMYNIVDSMFVARMPDMPGIEHTGELAVNALTLSFPIQMLIIAIVLQITRNREISISLKYWKPNLQIIGGIYSIGVSAIIMQALMSFMTYGVNIIFGRVSASAVTAYGIFYKIQQFVYFAGFGLRDSITPLVSYNYGKGSYKRVREGVKWGMIDTTVVMIIGVVILELFAHPLAQIFGLTAGTEHLCVLAMRIIATGFIFAGINIASQGVFQALMSGNSSLIVSFLRLLVIPLPLAYAFTFLNNATDVMWWAFPIGEAVAAVAAILLLKRIYRLKVEPMKDWK